MPFDLSAPASTVWYFAIGSMINPTSLGLREIRPLKSFAAKCPDWRLTFVGQGGMASVEPMDLTGITVEEIREEKKDDEQVAIEQKVDSTSGKLVRVAPASAKSPGCVHGVLYLLTEGDMKLLDSFESTYHREVVKCIVYDGNNESYNDEENVVMGTAYVMTTSKMDFTKPPKPPSERYIDIILRGCSHFGISGEYQAWLKTVQVVPRKKLSEFRSYPLPDPCLEFDAETLREFDGQECKDLYLAINGKVLKFVGDRNGSSFQAALKRGPCDITLRYARAIYEPSYPVANTLDEMCDEHKAFVEDMFFGFTQPNWTAIGKLRPRKSIDVSIPAEHIWYFAIGSMINPISLALRDIKPIRSYPASCVGWKLVFKGPGGMGSIDPDASNTMQGVVHLLTSSDMKVLDGIEMAYSRSTVDVIAYNLDTGEKASLQATAYIMDAKKIAELNKPDSLPSERYIDIIWRGCRYYGVDPEYQAWLKSCPCIPRKKPSEYCTYALPENPPAISVDELQKNNGQNDSELWMGLNGKVMKYVGECSGVFYEMSKARFAGKDSTVLMARNIFEPLYPIAVSLEAMSTEHRAFVEDFAFGIMGASYQAIGILQQ